MAANNHMSMDPLSRTISNESVQSHSSGHLLSASSSSIVSRKGRYAEIDATQDHSERASISMPPPALKPNSLRYQAASRRSSRIEAPATTLQSHSPLLHEFQPQMELPDFRGATQQPSSDSIHQSHSDSGLPIRRSEPDLDSNRMSFSSLYGSGKGAMVSGPSSVGGGSDGDGSRQDGTTTATQNLSVTTQSQNGALSPTLSGSMRETTQPSNSAQTTASGSPSNGPPSPAVTAPSRQGRTIANNRGRAPAASRRVSGSVNGSVPSAPPSVSHSLERHTDNPNKIGTIGICALDSKARSKPSRNILNRLVGKEIDFEVIIFGDKVILDENVENWPVCDFLISFFSDGFPLEKAIAYAKLRRPFCVNDLPMQTVLWDRRMCLRILDKLGVPTPERIEVNRDGGPVALTADIAARMKHLTGVELIGSDDGRGGGQPPPNDVHMEDDDDTLVVDGHRLRKPFVEKPTSGEDHNINIYYPKSQGGGGRRLFRKVNNKSSEKDETLIVPRAVTEPDGSYIYEQFLKVENAEDVKAYTVGTEFCHAETRKSPVVDGVVKRNPNGKEIRYVTKLNKEEQIMAAKIASGFGQRVCGFDLLRVDDKSYVIDVNGWSFVKDNNEYYDKCAQILKDMFIREKIKWQGRATPSEVDETESKDGSIPTSMSDYVSRKPTFPKDKELPSSQGHRGVLSTVFRSRSISQLRDHVHSAAHHVGHPHSAKSPSGVSSPITSPPTLERSGSFHKRHSTVPVVSTDMLPPAATSLDHIRDALSERPTSADLDSLAQSEAPSHAPAPAVKSQWKLKGMVAVIRHADRTPKQKFKFTFHTKPFVDLLKGHQEEVLLVGEAALHSVQQAVRQAMTDGVEDMNKLRTLANALAKKGAWPGTKVQIKPMFKKPKEAKESKEKDKSHEKEREGRKQSIPLVADPTNVDGTAENTTPKALPEGEDPAGPAGVRAQQRSDSLGEITMSRAAAADQNLVLDKLQLVMKWGGEPTHSARYQATDLGENMRADLTLMNRRVLDDVSIFTSSERRVKTSASIFASAFLDMKDVEDDQIHVRKDLLDDSNAAKDEMDKVKKKLKGLLRKGEKAPEQFAWPKDGTPEPYVVVRQVTELMKFHRKVMRSNFAKLQSSEAVTSLEKIQKSPGRANQGNEAAPEPETAALKSTFANATDAKASEIQSRWCTGEDAELFKERWEKLFNEFTDAEKVDPSKVSELYDTMKFDALHNRTFLEWVFTPSKAMLAEANEAGSPTLKRTESAEARQEFEQTHEGQIPASSTEPNGTSGDLPGMDQLQLPPPRRSDTASTSASNMEASIQSLRKNSKESIAKDLPKPTLSQRLGLRRRSADLVKDLPQPPGQPQYAHADDPSASYFNLFTGGVPGNNSKVKHDVRLEKLNDMYKLSKILFDFIGPQEYGITDSEKLEIGLLTSLPLLKEIVKDLEEVQASDDCKSFIYFTKESHIYTLLNCILEGGVQTKIARNAIPELDYLSQICFELYESENPDACAHNAANPDEPQQNPFNYSIRITISPGCHTFDPLDVQLDSKHCIGCAPRRSLTSHGEWREVLETLKHKFKMVKLPKSFTAVNLSERHPQEFVSEGEGQSVKGGGETLGEAGEVAVEQKEIEQVKEEAKDASGIALAH